MPKGEIIAAIDIGSKFVKCVVAETINNSAVEILGIGKAPSEGIKRGVVVDLKKASKAIEEAVGEAEKTAGFNIRNVYLGIEGGFAHAGFKCGQLAVTSQDNLITENDIRKVVDCARILFAPLPDYDIIQILPCWFKVDEGPEEKNPPIDMSGTHLEVSAMGVLARKTAVSNMTKAVEEAGLEIEDNGFILGSYCSGLSLLSEDMKEIGTILIDIGHDTTNVSVWKSGNIIFNMVVNIGAMTVTSDISTIFSISLVEAECLKISKGVALKSSVVEDEQIPVTSITGTGSIFVSKEYLAEIIESRLRDIFEKIYNELAKSGIKSFGAILLTGGTSSLPMIDKLAEDVFSRHVKIGKSVFPIGLSPEYADSAYSVCMGLIIYGASKKVRTEVKAPATSFMSKITDFFNKILQALHDVF